MRGLQRVRNSEGGVFEGYRGEGAERGLRSKTAPGGVSICVVYAIDSILGPSRRRFDGIPSRRGVLSEDFRRFRDHFGVQKWDPSGSQGSKKWDFEVRKHFSDCFFGRCGVSTPNLTTLYNKTLHDVSKPYSRRHLQQKRRARYIQEPRRA